MLRRDARGQGLVEFAVAVIPFLVLVMAVIDLSRGIWQMNTTAEAAREIARETSLHEWNNGCEPSCVLGSTTDVANIVIAQRALLPSMDFVVASDIVCVDILDVVKPDSECKPGDFVSVTVRSTFAPATPLTMPFGSHTFTSTSRVEIP